MAGSGTGREAMREGSGDRGVGRSVRLKEGACEAETGRGTGVRDPSIDARAGVSREGPLIVTCEQCQTRFQLDAARIPETGARVRCSRCKHAFFVVRPGAAARDAAVHALAGAAAAAGGTPAPSTTQDLGAFAPSAASGDTSATRLMPSAAPSAELAAPTASGEPESDWQFNDPVRDTVPQPRVLRRPAPRRVAPAPPEEGSSIDALGSPESWDILGDASLPPLDAVPATPFVRSAAAASTAAEPGRVSRAAARAPEEPAADHGSGARASARARWRESPRDLVLFAGVWLWIAAVAGAALLPHVSASRAEAIPTPEGVTIDDLRGRFLDNAVAGPLLVVTGEWQGGSDGRDAVAAAQAGGLEVVVLGPDGEVARAPLGDAPSEQRLREASPEALVDEIGGSAFARSTTPVAGSRRVAAVVPIGPRDVTGLLVEWAHGLETTPAAR